MKTDHSMAAATNNAAAGGSKNHRSSLQHGGAYGRALYSQNSGEPGDGKENLFPIVFVSFTVVAVLLRLVCCRVQKEQEAGDAEQPPPPPPPSRDPSTVAAVEVVPAAVRAAEPPLVCAFRKEDGWGDDSCGVCLAELADGEAVRVLPACMHFFHAACVNQWLRGHGTCPLCRAPLVAPSSADDT